MEDKKKQNSKKIHTLKLKILRNANWLRFVLTVAIRHHLIRLAVKEKHWNVFADFLDVFVVLDETQQIFLSVPTNIGDCQAREKGRSIEAGKRCHQD